LKQSSLPVIALKKFFHCAKNTERAGIEFRLPSEKMMSLNLMGSSMNSWLGELVLPLIKIFLEECKTRKGERGGKLLNACKPLPKLVWLAKALTLF
jgi:hypothetical protein